MTRVLLIKTSSLGDVIHCLPAVSDMAARVPDLVLEWVVEDAYAEIPRLHPAVSRVIPIAMRRWRWRPFAGETWRELAAMRATLNGGRYDAIVDAQGLIRLAWLGRVARGPVSGYDWTSIREPLASLFYHRRYPVSVRVHAAERMRRLAAQALGYAAPVAMDYGVVAPPFHLAWLPDRPFIVALHATARADKGWPIEHWSALGVRAAAEGLAVVLPWGSEDERERAERIAAPVRGAIVPPRTDFTGLAGLFAGAKAVVGVDTGLTHLASAVGAPVVALFSATWSDINGVIGPAFVANLGAPGEPPDLETVWSALQQALTAGPKTGPWIPTLAEAPPGRRKFRP